MWDPGSPTRDQTSIPDIESMKSQPLDHQEFPCLQLYQELSTILENHPSTLKDTWVLKLPT